MSNLAMLEVVARGLGPLKDEVVFVGGATIELYLTGSAAPSVRPTDDVDCVTSIVTRVEYHAMEDRLRELGFRNSMDPKAPICRWLYKEIPVDVMPVKGEILGFQNRWYPEAFARPITARLPDGQTIKIFDLPYLIACKIEAFKDRGREDFMASPDLEDIITVLDGAPDSQEKVLHAPPSVRTYLQRAFGDFLKDERFLDCLDGHLPPSLGEGRVVRVRSILQDLAAS